MKSEIKWETGTPTEFGFYLTVRESPEGERHVTHNQYATDEICKNPLPSSCPQGWQIMHPDGCKIVAWCKLSDIMVEDEISISGRKIEVVQDDELSKLGDPRFIVIDSETGEVLDNAQGYGYKSKRNAIVAFTYKAKPKKKKNKNNYIGRFLKKHQELEDELDDVAFRSMKSGDELNEDVVKQILKDCKITLPTGITAKELLQVYLKK